jgi:hypothetical protein
MGPDKSRRAADLWPHKPPQGRLRNRTQPHVGVFLVVAAIGILAAIAMLIAASPFWRAFPDY